MPVDTSMYKTQAAAASHPLQDAEALMKLKSAMQPTPQPRMMNSPQTEAALGVLGAGAPYRIVE